MFAVKSYLHSWCFQCSSRPISKFLTVFACITDSGRLFHISTVFKIINDIYDPLTTVDMFEQNTTSNTRGHSKKMKIKTSRLNVRKYTFVVRIVEIWNSLQSRYLFVALLCTFSIFSISPTLNGDQTASAYSI
jgi:hypothetical protein